MDNEDAAWIDDCIALGKRIAKFYGESAELTPTALDRVFNAWKADAASDKPSNSEIAQGLGCTFGHFLVCRHGARWVVVTDNFGTALAVVNSQTGWRTFPIDSVLETNCSRQR